MKRNMLLLGLLVFALVLTGCRHREKPAAVSLAEEDPSAVAAKPENPAEEEPEAPQLPTMETSLDDYPLNTPTDDILVLVNKTHPVTRDYVADDLVTVVHCDPNVGNKDTKKMRKVAADAIEELIAGAKEDGYDIVMRTGYRSYDYQDYLFNSYAANYGEAEANTYSARPGQSEHQTGWCCDVGVLGVALTDFDYRPEAVWIADNCWKYGFILRYPADKTDITGYIYESWHIRYVGKDVAQYIYENGLTLEEYLGILD
ncbi:MAG: M15 family metallopeptidase [Firmicutes bacterium]|nr:M15 family metallopeptidase [Bacillota bacterium]